jgi:RNA polymerase sigma-70 factor, ECF subfamily
VSAPPTKKSQGDDAPQTLGQLLYADPTKPRASEQEWIALVEAIAMGDQGALHALYERTHRLVFTLIMRITDSRPAAEELTLDVFHDVWRRASAYDASGGSVLGWIMNQARSRAIDRLRYERRKKRASTGVSDSPAAGPTADIAEETMERRDQSRRLQNALKALSPEERHVIETAYFGEQTYAQVAAQLHQPLGTVKTRIRSGLEKLRRALESSGL